ncbi:uncharacterized protein PADG_00406 [Paracoccidioides brasiliensis Pb18]|uniref:Hydrophobin n=1 Tax=Paracoccidioides brasiliensis (strain Pb18) TaxID=502780 RepID=C1G0L6_PARBD|nr:uncharacterized protein PADG_00406 [Paracoccidioides brasiliensis Pb18]EEH44117.2 hypothetical protein PADG_00406 [Paracoccidioides brasiliensis Pb18]
MKLQFPISAFAFISSIVNVVALPPSHQPRDIPNPLAIRDGRPSSANCNSVPQCCEATYSSEDRLVIQGLKMFELDPEGGGKSGFSVATLCKFRCHFFTEYRMIALTGEMFKMEIKRANR